MDNERWADAPDGDEFAYLIRFSNVDGTSPQDPKFRWPSYGHVECEKWEGDTRDGGGGLWGHLDGDSEHKSYFLDLIEGGGCHLVQAVTVRRSEVQSSRDAFRVPRGFVRHAGRIDQVTAVLMEEGDYSKGVIRRLLAKIDRAYQFERDTMYLLTGEAEPGLAWTLEWQRQQAIRATGRHD